MSDNENRPGYYVDELQERIAELEAELEAEVVESFDLGYSKGMLAGMSMDACAGYEQGYAARKALEEGE
jgi:hypothetical protein